MFDPAQSVAVPPAVGAAGIGLTATFTVPIGLLQPSEFTVNEYIPVASVVAPTIVGFCTFEVKLFGPVQL
jgi:hypothetical protein